MPTFIRSTLQGFLRRCPWLVAFALHSLPAASGVPGRLLVGYSPRADQKVLRRVLRSHGAIERSHLADLGVHVVEVPPAATDAIQLALRASALFDFVEPDSYAEPAATPNDPSYGLQWHLSQISAPDAWSVTTGSPTVVALIDSGVDDTHPDLASKLIPGWNFLESNSHTSDTLGHGTAVAGALAAATDNGVGVAGVAWKSLIMPLVVVNSDGSASYSQIAAAIQYAADRQVRLINVSVGGKAPSATLQRAVDYAWAHKAMVFAAAMNDGSSTPSYPAACEHAIAVTSTDRFDRLAPFANFGPWITLAAPGTDILTAMGGGGYGFGNGTSFSVPIATGVAALILALNPDRDNEGVVSILKESADPVCSSPLLLDCRRVNAARAVFLAASPSDGGGSGSEPVHYD